MRGKIVLFSSLVKKTVSFFNQGKKMHSTYPLNITDKLGMDLCLCFACGFMQNAMLKVNAQDTISW